MIRTRTGMMHVAASAMACVVMIAGAGVTAVTDVAALANPLEVTGGSARAAGMGSAFVGVADDSSAILWNPAGLGGLSGLNLGMHHTTWLAGINQETAVLGLALGGLGVVGAAVNYVQYGTFAGYDEGGVQTGDFGASRYGFALGWGDEVIPTLSLGVAARASMQTTADIAQSAFSADLGALWVPVAGLRVGLVYANVGTDVVGYALASAVRGGASYVFRIAETNRLLLAAAGTWEPGGVNRLHVGVEDILHSVVALRVGYQANLAEDEITGLTGIGAGIGFMYRGFGLDYAYRPFGDLGTTQRISLSYHTGGDR